MLIAIAFAGILNSASRLLADGAKTEFILYAVLGAHQFGVGAVTYFEGILSVGRT